MAVHLKTMEQQINELKAIHGDKYIYIQPSYMPTIDYLEVHCRTHGKVDHSIRMMLKGNGCYACYGVGKPNILDVVERFKIIWGDIYDYSTTQYHRKTLKVNIICKMHGQFWMKPITHLKGSGCPSCRKKGLRYPTHIEEKISTLADIAEDWLKQATAQKVNCHLHGEFEVVIKKNSDRICPVCKDNKKTAGKVGLGLNQITSFEGLASLVHSVNTASQVAKSYEQARQ